METRQPTEKELREFWEWCGFTHNRGLYAEWTYPDGEITTGQSPLDLNNLFKYAKPQFIMKYGLGQWTNLLHRWIDELYKHTTLDDPALALFWAIYPAIDK